MVGHTHEDIDQVFSKVSTQMMKTSVYDMDGIYILLSPGALLQPNYVKLTLIT